MHEHLSEGGGGGGAPGAAVEVAVAYGLEHVVGTDVGRAFEVSYRAGHLEDAVVCAGAHIEAHHRVAQYALTLVVEAAIARYLARRHASVAVGAGLVLETLGLDGARGYHAPPYRLAALGRL